MQYDTLGGFRNREIISALDGPKRWWEVYGGMKVIVRIWSGGGKGKGGGVKG